MLRTLFCCIALVACSLALPGRRHCLQPGDPDPAAMFAVAAPSPALRYQLLPELAEMNPGNPCRTT